MVNPVRAIPEAATATIASSGSLSGAVNLGGRVLVGVILPATWTAADLTFQVSIDGTTYANLYRETATGDAQELALSAAAGYAFTLSPWEFVPWRWVKVRSGTAAAAVNQAGERSVTLLLANLSG